MSYPLADMPTVSILVSVARAVRRRWATYVTSPPMTVKQSCPTGQR